MKNGARSKTRVIAKANRWRLITTFISIPFCGRVKKYIGNLGAEPRDPMIFPELEFLELKIVCDAGVEGWHILPAPALPMIR